MNFKKLQNQPINIKGLGLLTLKLASNEGNFTVFEYLNKKEKKVELGDEIDYLVLYAEIASMLYQVSGNEISSFVMISEMGGKRLFLIDFPEVEQKKYCDSFGYLVNEQKKLEQNPSFSFIGDVRLELASDPLFDKNTKKLLKTLAGDNQTAWQSLIEEKKDFIKTELFIYSLQKLHSWSFQAIKNQTETLENINYVYGKKPKPRGADLK